MKIEKLRLFGKKQVKEEEFMDGRINSQKMVQKMYIGWAKRVISYSTVKHMREAQYWSLPRSRFFLRKPLSLPYHPLHG